MALPPPIRSIPAWHWRCASAFRPWSRTTATPRTPSSPTPATSGPGEARAQANSFEGLPFFIGAVLAALQLGAPQARVDLLALLYVLLRLGFIITYVGGLATLRSAVWGLAFAVNVAILFQGWR